MLPVCPLSKTASLSSPPAGQKQDEAADDSKNSADLLVGNRFKVQARIGAGAFGTIYAGVDIITNTPVAIKMEPKGIKVRQLAYEAHVYRELQTVACMPRMHAFVEKEDGDSSLVMELLGPSLEDLFNDSNRLFPLHIVLNLADQMIQRIEALHSRHFLHRDIKPDNFVVERAQKSTMEHLSSSTIFLIDFGLAKAYRRPGNSHIPFRDGKHLTGTARYASLNAHRGYEQSRRDDLESLGYVLIYFLRGSLPWQGLGRPKKPPPGTRLPDGVSPHNLKYAKIAECKRTTSIAELTNGLSPEFAAYFAHVRGLRFEERPDYDYLRKLFKAVLKREVLGKKREPQELPRLGAPVGQPFVSAISSSAVTLPNSATSKEYVPGDGSKVQPMIYNPHLGLSAPLPVRISSSQPRIVVSSIASDKKQGDACN